jgi:hypothetical protein
MYASTDNILPSRSVLMRALVRSREYCRPRTWVRVRLAFGAFNLLLGALLLAAAPWLGPFTWLAALPLAGGALIFWTAYRLRASVQS